MKAMSQIELQSLVQHLRHSLVGAQLQDVHVNDRGLLFQFYKEGGIWLLMDLAQAVPLMLDFSKRPPFAKGKPKPVSLFLNSHAVDGVIKDIEIMADFGRVVKIEMTRRGVVTELELRLIPKQCNLIVRSQDRAISWDKPKELSFQEVNQNLPEPRPLEQIRQEWLGQFQQSHQEALPSQDPQRQWELKREKDLLKKRKALVGIQEQLNSGESESWRKLGVWLQSLRDGECPFPELYQSLQPSSVGEQIQACFAKAKQLEAKRAGTMERAKILEKEISDLERSTYRPNLKSIEAKKDLMAEAGAKGRKLQLEGGLLAYLGKSASDNLALLRRAKSWDYWIHLKDYPSAYALIHRNRDQVVPDKTFEQTAKWLLKESSSAKNLEPGLRLAVVIVECRFVKPIKGDKIGRVTYQSEKTIYVTL